jgi:thiamine-phosphate pyrophosphorylase
VEEAVRAEEEGADYLGVGPVFEARGTKADAGEPLGLDLIAQVRLRCRIPIVAIGGIRAENARKVREAGADAVAVISAVVAAEDIAQAARRLKHLLCAAEEDPGK